MTNPQATLDTRALEAAVEARAMAHGAVEAIRDHEGRCLEQGRRVESEIQGLRGEVKAVHSRIDVLAGKRETRDLSIRNTIILALLSLVGYLLTMGAPWTQ